MCLLWRECEGDAAWPLASRQNRGRARGRWLHWQGWDLQLTQYGDGHWRATFCMHDGTWFMAPNHAGTWAVVPAGRVPQPVLAVPHAYYKVPPGPAKKMSAQDVPPGHAKGHGGKKGRDD